VSELACPIEAFKFLAKHMSWDEFILPTYQKAWEEGAALAKQVVGMCPVVYPDTNMKYWRYLDDENKQLQHPEYCKKIHYPFIVYLAGSASGCLLVSSLPVCLSGLLVRHIRSPSFCGLHLSFSWCTYLGS
jgi:hypothetical protein